MVKIAGIQKMTLLDYPGKVACTIFLQGCNFRCPFCHNSELLPPGTEADYSEEDIIAFLKKRAGLLEGVCVSGGEPTVQPELVRFIRSVKDLGYAVKLDTNGSHPEVLQTLMENGLIDYVAMDIKNSPSEYAKTAGTDNLPLEKIEQSIRLLATGNTPFEFRTTLVRELHSEESLLEMSRWLEKIFSGKTVKKLFLQPFVDRDTVAFSGLHAPDLTEMTRYTELLAPYIEEVKIRG